MAKDDYFVVVYKILKYLYDCLKHGKIPDFKEIDYEHLDINEDYWKYIIVNLLESNLVKGVKVIESNHGLIIRNINIQITPTGIEYLFENSLLQKIKRTLKDIRDIAPFI